MARWQFSFMLLLLFVCGCGSTGTVARIEVSPGSASLGALQTQQFYATAYDSVGKVILKSFTWSVSGNIGTIEVASGLFYAGATFESGSVSATADGVVGSATVSIANNGTLTGNLTNADGERVPYIRLYLTAAPTFAATTDTNGLFSIYNIPAGTYEIKTTENTTYLSSTAEATIVVGKTTTQIFSLTSRLGVENESFSGDPITVTGTVRNNGATTALGVVVSYVFYDEEGNVAGAGSQALGNLSPGLGRSYAVIPFPTVSTSTTRSRTVTCTSF
jgi:hypothetical protein